MTLKQIIPSMRCRRFRKGTVVFTIIVFLSSAYFVNHFNEHLEQHFVDEDLGFETIREAHERREKHGEDESEAKSVNEEPIPPPDKKAQEPPSEEMKPMEQEEIKPMEQEEIKPMEQEEIKPMEQEETKEKEREDKPKSEDKKPEKEQLEESKEHIVDKQNEPMKPENSAYIDALKAVMSPDRVVLLSLVDVAFVSMAVNFYQTSIQPFGIQNYLILTMHKDTCSQLAPYKINCFQYLDDIEGNNKANEVGTPEFIAKMNVRTDMIIEALQAGISVLHSDTDVLFLKNPFEHIPCKSPDCDIAPLVDYYVPNAGFLLVHPSALPLYLGMRELSHKEPSMNDQDQLNKILGQMKQTNSIKIIHLPKNEFQSGKLFYDDGGRIYADSAKPCPECIVVHNNWIIGLENKIYRAKEMHQWVVDHDGYYTSTSRKYITYENTKPYTKEGQINALKSALAMARILNRVVILPKFYNDEQKECGFHVLVRVKHFEPKFSGVYREHSFLTHPLVPKQVTGSVKRVSVSKSSLTDKDVRDNYGSVQESILYFEQINFVVSFNAEQNHFDGLIKKGLVTH